MRLCYIALYVRVAPSSIWTTALLSPTRRHHVREKKYEVAFDFTSEKQEDLRSEVYAMSAGKRLIKAELGLTPSVDNGCDVRYATDDPAEALELLKLAFTISAGGWIVCEPMPKGIGVFHLPTRGHKYSNQRD